MVKSIPRMIYGFKKRFKVAKCMSNIKTQKNPNYFFKI